MSEKAPQPSHKEHAPSPESSGKDKERLEHLKHKAEQAEKAERGRHNIEQLKEHAKEAAKSHKETQPHHEKESHESVIGTQRDIKTKAYKDTMRKARSHLKPTQRTFSKIIHQPVVDAVSEFSAKTVARPSAILGGGIMALIGSGFFLFMAKYYGFGYNFFVYIAFLAVGFVLGLLVELLFHRRNSTKS